MTTTDEYRQLHGEFTRLLQEGDRKDIELIEERALADDLAEVLYRYLTDFTQHPEVQRVMARYREARA